MAAIYQAGVWCDDCADSIRDRICDELWERKCGPCCPDYTNVDEFDCRDDLDDHLRGMDERSYDSGEYPKDCDDDEECDCPQHCAAGPSCINAEDSVGYFFGNSLTTDGADYVKDAVREDVESGHTDSVACTVWMPYYDWIDYGNIGTCDSCDDLAVCDDDGLCSSCADTDDEFDPHSLGSGDEVYWDDPDNGAGSRTIVIRSITAIGDAFCITGTDGSVLECLAHELS